MSCSLASRVPDAVPLRVAEQAHHNRAQLVTPVLPTQTRVMPALMAAATFRIGVIMERG